MPKNCNPASLVLVAVDGINNCGSNPEEKQELATKNKKWDC